MADNRYDAVPDPRNGSHCAAVDVNWMCRGIPEFEVAGSEMPPGPEIVEPVGRRRLLEPGDPPKAAVDGDGRDREGHSLGGASRSPAAARDLARSCTRPRIIAAGGRVSEGGVHADHSWPKCPSARAATIRIFGIAYVPFSHYQKAPYLYPLMSVAVHD